MGQNELDINECDAQIPHIIKNLRSPNEVRGNNRRKAVIEDTLITRAVIENVQLPEYYIVTATLVDENGKELCQPYTNKMYTKEIPLSDD